MYRNRFILHLCLALVCVTQVATAALRHGNIKRDTARVPALRRLLDSSNKTLVHAGETTVALRETSAAFGAGTTPVPATDVSTSVFQPSTTPGPATNVSTSVFQPSTTPGPATNVSTSVFQPSTTPGPATDVSTSVFQPSTTPKTATNVSTPVSTPGPHQNFSSTASDLGTTPTPHQNFSSTAPDPGTTTVPPETTPGPNQKFSTTALNLVTTTVPPETTPGPQQTKSTTALNLVTTTVPPETTPGPQQTKSTTAPDLGTTTMSPETTTTLETTKTPETTPEPQKTQNQPLPTSILFFTFRVDYSQADFTELLPAFKKAMQLTLGPKFTQVRAWIGDAVRRAGQDSTLVSASVSGPAASIRELAQKIQADSPSFLRALNEELSRQSLTAATLIRVSDAQGTRVTGLVSATSGGEDDYLVKLKTHVLVIIFFGTSIGVSVVSVVIYATRRQCWLFQDGARGRDPAARREATILGLAEDTDLLPAPAVIEVDLERAVSPAGDGLVNRRSHRTADPV